MRKQSRIISIFLGLMLAVAGGFSQTNFKSPVQAQPTSGSALVNLSSIMGYSQNGNSYNYVYFGEYPKTRVETSSETTIKGYIKTLNEYYYRTYLLDSSNPHHSMQSSSYLWTDETANTTQVKNFYPQEDYENANLSFDFRSGYYTLKTAVDTYPIGTKIHTFNQTVAWYEKMGSGYTTNGGTTLNYVPDASPEGYISAGLGVRSETNGYDSKKIYLFTVEPIKWRVLANDSDRLTLLADTILDSTTVVTWNANQNEWAYSDIRGWLNGGPTTTYENSIGGNIYTRYYEDRNFFTRAFTTAQQNAIATTQHSQDTDASWYQGTWHSYTQAAVSDPKFGGPLESRPTTEDRVYLLSQIELDGTYNNAADFAVPVANAPNADYGFPTGSSGDLSRRTPNTPYSIATGNYNNPSTGSGYWLSRSAGTNFNQYVYCIATGGSVQYYPTYSSYGVRPALNLSISTFNDSGLITETANDTPVESLGTENAPILLSETTPVGASEYALWSFDKKQSNASNSQISSSIESAKMIDDVYENKIKVNFSNVKVGTALYAQVKDSTSTLVFGAITPLLTSATNTGETFFTFTSTSPVDDIDIAIYSAENYSLFVCGVFEADDNPDLTRNLPTVYLDPAQTNGGNDSNTGKKTHSPVATLERARSLVAKGGNIILMSPFNLSVDTTLNFGDFIVSKLDIFISIFTVEQNVKVTINDLKYESNNETKFTINTNGVLIFNNCDINIKNANVYDVFISSNASLIINGGRFATKSPTFATYLSSAKITVNNATFYDCGNSTGSIFVPSLNNLYSADITLNKTIFEGNSGHLGSVVNMNAGSLTVNGGRFANNTATVGGVFYINALNGTDCPVSINGAVFEGNSTSGTYVLSTADYDVKHSGSGEDTDSTNYISGGGVIFCSQPLVIENSKFIKNKSNSSNHHGGGAIFVSGGKSSLDLSNCQFNENYSKSKGGALMISMYDVQELDSVKSVSIMNCVFSKNTANHTGAIYIRRVQESLTIKNSVFIENKSETIGGAITDALNSDIYVYDSIFSENSALDDGGAVYNKIVAYNCAFYKNEALNGGAAGGAKGLFYDCFFYQNIATFAGGAVRNATLYDCDIYQNRAAGGGAVDSSTLYNCNVYENYSPTGSIILNSEIKNCRIYNNHSNSSYGIIYAGTLSGCEIFGNYCAGDYATLTGTYSNVTFANNVTASPSGGFAVDGATFSGKIGVYGNRIGADYREKTFTVGTDNTSVTIRIPIVGADGKLQGGTPNDTTLWEDDGTVMPFMISYSTPTLNLPLDITTFASGEDLSEWVSGATIKDSTGQLVSGTWRSTGGTLSYATITLPLQFYPTHVGKYSQEYLSVAVNVKRQANAIYYAKVSGVNNFYLVSSPTAATPVLGISIEQAVSFLANNGTFSFLTPYIVPAGASISLSTDGRNLTFVRTHTGEMFNVATGGFLQLGARTMAGKILLDGGSDILAVNALIVNAGILNIYGNISIAGARNVNSSEGQGGAVFNTGTADLNFTEIRDCRAVIPATETGFGGAIYNAGIMNLANIKISDCLAPNGGAIFSEGKLNMTNCLLLGNKGWQIGNKNVDVLGNTIRVQGGGNAIFKMTDCKISASYAVMVDGNTAVDASANVYGGALYVSGEVDAEINSSTISNCSARFGGGVFVGETGNLKAKNVVIQNCETSNTVGSAIYSKNADNVVLDDCLFVANATTAGTVQPGENGLHGTTGSFVLTSASFFVDEELQADAKTSTDNLIVALAMLGLLATFTLTVTFKTKSFKARKK